MLTMDAIATDLFNALLKQWRGEGKVIGWPELSQAARIAQEDQEQREQTQEGSE